MQKQVLSPLILLLFLSVNFCFGQVEARTHDIINEVRKVERLKVELNPKDSHHITVNLRESYGTVILVEAIISLEKGDTKRMESLLEQGRYKLIYEIDEEQGIMTLHRPRDLEQLKDDEGTEIGEYIMYNIAVPGHIEF